MQVVSDKPTLADIVEKQRALRAQQAAEHDAFVEEYCEKNPEAEGCRKEEDLLPVPSAPPLCKESQLSTANTSWYGSLPQDLKAVGLRVDGFHGRQTASGEWFNTNDLTLAHRSLPHGTIVNFRTPDGGFVQGRVNDRGPFTKNRDGSYNRTFDLSRALAQKVWKVGTNSTIYWGGVGFVQYCTAPK